MNSVTWTVNLGEIRYIAKAVPFAEQSHFEAGLAASEQLHHAGFTSGRPIRSAAGQLSEPVRDYALALLEFVPGRPLDCRDPLDQQWWGDRLGAAHRALAGFGHPGLPAWHWVRPQAQHLGIEDWIRPAVTAAVQDLQRLQVRDRLTFGVLHGDPYHGAFRLDVETGRIGVIDWGAVVRGPMVYDIASAVMYAGGIDQASELIAAYAATEVVPSAEVTAALPAMLRFRWAVQADYFAARVHRDPCEENLTGLHDARIALCSGAAVRLPPGSPGSRSDSGTPRAR